MILQKMKLDEANVLEFDLQVFGTDQKDKEVRFVIEGKDFSILCPCKEDENGISVKIPKLKGILSAGVYESKLEVVIDGKIFTPLNEAIELQPLIEFDVETKAVNPIKEGVTVSMKNATPSFEDSKPNNFKVAMDEGYQIEKVGGFSALKKDGKYWGFVSEKALVKTDIGHDTVQSLMEAV